MSDLNVKIRMYNVGELGDCFLLTFLTKNGDYTVLVDCGSFRNGADSKRRIKEIADDIVNAQRNADGTTKPIDVVVGTHQHNDHLSGFVHAKENFSQIKFLNIWLSWLDNASDKQADRIAKGQRKLANKLTAITNTLSKVSELKDCKVAEHIRDILGFYDLGVVGQSSSPRIPQEGIDTLKKAGTVRYLEPGQVINIPGLSSDIVKVYVLGPPRDNDKLFDINPKKDESYDAHFASAISITDDLLSSLTNFTDNNGLSNESFFPFDRRYELSISKSAFLDTSYNLSKNDWRKIDQDWLNQAEHLALYLDSYTNNSSLVIAIELVESKKVLLFVGDAQTGNWLSWKTIDWGKANISLDDLLEKTVLYKVGHHGSHNATLPEYLEKMKHPELVAMIPVDVNDPNIAKPNGWKMPAKNLYKRIKEITSGRILRMDGRYQADCDISGPIANQNWKNLHPNVSQQALYVEYTVNG